MCVYVFEGIGGFTQRVPGAMKLLRLCSSRKLPRKIVPQFLYDFTVGFYLVLINLLYFVLCFVILPLV